MSQNLGEVLPLLNGTVHLDIDDITNAVNQSVSIARQMSSQSYALVLSKVGVQGDHALLAELPAEGILENASVQCRVEVFED